MRMNSRHLRVGVALHARVRSLSAGKGGRHENPLKPEGRLFVWFLFGYRSRRISRLIIYLHKVNLLAVFCLIQSLLRRLYGTATCAGCSANLIAERVEVDLRCSRHGAIQNIIDNDAARASGGRECRDRARASVDPIYCVIGCRRAGSSLP
jgi:hypothetical protein